MTAHQQRHHDRKWMKLLKQHLKLDFECYAKGYLKRPDPKRLRQ